MLNIKTNSKLVKPGDIFVAIKGHTVDGHDYIEEAIKNGASKIVATHGSYSVPTVLTNDTQSFLNNYLSSNYSKCFDDLKIIGITGTNGKTTSTYLISQILSYLGISNAYIGTLGYYVGDVCIKKLKNTTPDILTLYNVLTDAKKRGVKVVCMEVSSHSLEENRIEGIKFDVAAFTNLTQDHLDFHKTMNSYLDSKKKILNHIKNSKVMIVNNDDEYAGHFKVGNFETFGINKDSTYKVNSYKMNEDSTKIVFTYKGREYLVTTSLLGKFNIYNYMTAVCVVNNLGISMKDIIKVTPLLKAPPGRNEVIDVFGAKAVIDYAHTPDAVLKIINTAREYTKGNIITITGCGGDRDKGKRPIMGYLATTKSDYVIFTNDNPRGEKEEEIIKQILGGAKQDNYQVIYDREEAINTGLSMLKKDDTLLILGKGHEEYQIIGKNKFYFSDKEKVFKYLRENELILRQKKY